MSRDVIKNFFHKENLCKYLLRNQRQGKANLKFILKIELGSMKQNMEK